MDDIPNEHYMGILWGFKTTYKIKFPSDYENINFLNYSFLILEPAQVELLGIHHTPWHFPLSFYGSLHLDYMSETPWFFFNSFIVLSSKVQIK